MSIEHAQLIGTGVNPDEYHAQKSERGTIQFSLGSSQLRTFAQCPARWVAGYEPPDSEAKEYGSLLDCLALTPDQFGKRYAIEPGKYKNEKGEEKPWNNNANACKDWRELQVGREIIKAKQYGECQTAIKRMLSDEIIAAWFDASDRQVWLSAKWHDETTGLVVPLKCLLDFVPRKDSEFCKCAGDLKTTRNGSLLVWQRFCYQMGYHVQAAFNLDLLAAATKEDRNTFCFILQENFPPWQPAKRMLAEDFLTLGRASYQNSLANYCQCLKSGKWPDYDMHDESVQGWSVVRPEPFMAEREAFAPHFSFTEPEEAPAEQIEDDVVP